MIGGMEEATAWLFDLTKFGEKNGLENIRELLHRLGDPQSSFKSVHVAGSDGKGSTCSMIYSVLRQAGLRTGLYTSPHILRVNERVEVDGRQISDEEFLGLMDLVRKVIDDMRKDGFACTFFEAMTAIGFLHFRNEHVDYAVVEVGMGGRFDATNILVPEVSVICNISLEHTQFLGNTIEEIAFEKAGVIKPGVPVVTCNGGPALDVIRRTAEFIGSPLVCSGVAEMCACDGAGSVMTYHGMTYTVGIPGSFQSINSAMVVEAVSRISAHIPEQAVISGIAKASWPGRMQKIDGMPLIVDVTHTSAGMKALGRDVLSVYGKVVTVFGVLDDKDVEHMSQIVADMSDRVIVCRPASARALPEDRAYAEVSRFTSAVEKVSDVPSAIERAMEIADGRIVLVTGSFAMAEAAFRWLEASFSRMRD